MSNSSGLSGGRSMFAFSPVREDGRTRKYDNVPSDTNIIGTHNGDYAGLNVLNPEPGKYYQWAKRTPEARMREAQKSGRPVTASDNAAPAYTLGLVTDESDTPTPLDTAQVYQDVVLFEYDEDIIAARRREESEASLRAIREADREFLHGASAAELATSPQRTRFAQRRHSLQMQDGAGGVVNQWSPDQGILDN